MFEEVDVKNRHAFCGWLVVHSEHHTTGLNGQSYQCRGWALHD